jgi:hypothetical protein
MKKTIYLTLLVLFLAGCSSANPFAQVLQPASRAVSAAGQTQTTATPPTPVSPQAQETATQQTPGSAQPQATAAPLIQTSPPPTATGNGLPVTSNNAQGTIPNFDHIILIVLENEYLQDVLGSTQMPNFNALASKYVLLSNYFAVTHPSLPNYLVLVSGSTQNVTSDCSDCFVNQPNLADEIEASGRTWKSYQESMPSPCFIGNKSPYLQWTNPFLYFDSIRLDPARCDRSIVPLTQLDADLAANQLPNFALIMPNRCDSGHDCPAPTADTWVSVMVTKLQASPALGENSLIIITFDEGAKKGSDTKTRGQVATVLISPLASPGFSDPMTYTHYSLLKTILTAWNLPDLGETGQASTQPIQAPWLWPMVPISANNQAQPGNP